MTITLDADPGSATANSFVLLVDAEAYLATRLNASAWGSDDEKKKAALCEATRDISILEYEGSRADTTQRLSWPRVFAVDPDKPNPLYLTDIAELYFDDSIVPQRIKDATCELALEYLRAGTTDVASLDPQIGIIEKTVDKLTTRFSEPYQRAQGLARFPRVLQILTPLISDRAVGGLTIIRT